MGFSSLHHEFTLLDYLKGIAFVRAMLDKSTKQALGASVSQYRIMLYLDEHPDSRSKDAALGLHMKANTFSLAFSSLETKGYTERRINEKDNRETFLRVTDAGKRALIDTDNLIVSRAKALWGPLTTQQKRTVAGFDNPESIKRPTIHYVSTIIELSSLIDSELKVFGINSTQFLILLEIRKANASVRPINLMARLDLQSNTVAAALDRLEALGLVSRTKNPQGSATDVSLEDKGCAITDNVAESLEASLWEYASASFKRNQLITQIEANRRMVEAYSS